MNKDTKTKTKPTTNRQHNAKPVARKTQPKPAQNPKRKNKSKNESKNKNKPLMRTVGTNLVVFIFFAAVILYLANGATSMVKKTEIPTLAVEYGSIDLPTVLGAVIVRDEQVYESHEAGTVSFNYDDQTRVRKGSQVCVISNQEALGELTKNLAATEEEILNLQDRRGEYSGFSQDAKRINKQMQDILDKNRQPFFTNNFSSVYQTKDDIVRNITLRNNMLLSENRGSMKDMVEQKSIYEGQINKNIAYMETQTSGLLSYLVDGQEPVLTFDTMADITPEQTRMKVEMGETSRKKTVTLNEPVFKIVNSNIWYLALYAPKEMVTDWLPDQTRTIFIEKTEGFHPIDMEVTSIVPGDKEDYLLLKSTKNMTDYLDVRNVNVKLSHSGHEGLKIPSSTIRDETLLKIPNEFVYETPQTIVIRKGIEVDETIPITPQSKDELFHYVLLNTKTPLKIGDVLVQNSEKSVTYELAEVENVKGVYLLNNGYADFCKIVISAQMPESTGFVILDTALNPGLRVNDQLIYETNTISDGQKIK